MVLFAFVFYFIYLLIYLFVYLIEKLHIRISELNDTKNTTFNTLNKRITSLTQNLETQNSQMEEITKTFASERSDLWTQIESLTQKNNEIIQNNDL